VSASHFRCGDFQVDLTNRRFLSQGRETPLEPRVFAVIAQLLLRPGELVTRNELLDAVWGHRYVTPSTLNRTIALARRAFGDEVAEARYIQTVHGAGYRYVGPVQALGPAQIAVRARFEPPFAARLPARIDALIGREDALSALLGMLRSQRAVTVLGAGGMGKTQCALEAARRAADDFPDGVWFFDLSPVRHAGEWLRMLSSALAMPSAIPEAQVPQLCALLQDRVALIVLDNCDQVAPDVGAIVIQLLRGTHALRFLATSQRPLNLTGEQILRIPPLQVPQAEALETLPPDSASDYPAVALLLRRIRAIRPDFVIDAGNAPVLGEICRQLDGMPLALELAAARFALLSPHQVLERLVQRFRFLESGAAGRDHRHRNLRSLLDWSYGMLSSEEQRLLNWSAVFVQSWSAEAFVALAGSLGHDAEAAIDLLSGLASHSLVSVLTEVTPPRYRLLESVREYARLHLRGAGLEEAARAAHLEAMTHVCRRAQAEMLAGRMRERVEQLALDRGNLQAALETAAAVTTDHPQALEMLGALLLYAKGHGDYLTVMRWCRMVLEPESAAPTAARARALLTLGVVQMHLGPADAFMPGALAEAARIAAAHDDEWTEAYALGYDALRCANLGNPDEAERYASRLWNAPARAGDELLTGLAHLARGWIWLARGRAESALLELRAATDLGPDLHQRHFVVTYIGLAQFALGRDREAAGQWLESLHLSIAVGNVRGMAGAIEGCAYLACRAGDWRTAARLLAAARGIRERTQVPIFNFWRPHQSASQRLIEEHLATDDLAACTQQGVALRQEDATNEALRLLRRYASGSAHEAQVGLNRPAGS
jgi:non-specific serine/threonine protein kinase